MRDKLLFEEDTYFHSGRSVFHGLLALLLLLPSVFLFGQEAPKEKAVFRDTLDGKLDFSRFIIDLHGFLPIAMIITEPALGNFGVGAGPVFLKKKKRPEGYKGYIAPDITAGFGMYTLNNSWLVGGLRMGSFPKLGIKYRVGGGYGSINLDFYRTLQDEDRKFSFNIETVPIILSVAKRILKDEVYLGVKYFFMKSILSPNFTHEMPDFITSKEIDNLTAALGGFIDWDKRNTIFTPDKGFRVQINYDVNASWTGSDFNYQSLAGSGNWFVPILHNWVSGLRLEGQQIFNNPPFYMLPSVNMRGIPFARYQGQTIALVETEQRYDFGIRWSILGFIGASKAALKDENFWNTQTNYAGGAGFRYQLARAFKLRAGIDLACSSDGFAYYIVFGHNWNR